MTKMNLTHEPMLVTLDIQRFNFHQIGGVAAWLAGGLLLAGLALSLAGSRAGTWLQDNFMLRIIQLHTGVSSMQEQVLFGLKPVDILLLASSGLICLALYPTMKGIRKAWAVVATTLPFLGLALYLVTQDIGRSGMLAALVITNLILLRSSGIAKPAAWVGLLAGIALLVGDVGTAFSYQPALAGIMDTGYVFLIMWCALIGRILLHKEPWHS
ncbi:MAG: hypothetical protein JW704_00320 [Anaerolineaceae bacterium]|nr:hypothetical protein [Anaerolineaceae bacterium]MBN2676689.1 hypothetical protein [Anaerolineaceae bacterium]